MTFVHINTWDTNTNMFLVNDNLIIHFGEVSKDILWPSNTAVKYFPDTCPFGDIFDTNHSVISKKGFVFLKKNEAQDLIY